MAIGQLAAKGSFVTFNGNVYRSSDLSKDGSINEIDATHLLSEQDEFIAGTPSREVSVNTLGSVAVSEGDTGLLLISWSDGTYTPDDGVAANYVCTKCSKAAKVRGLITQALTFKPAASMVV